MHWNCQSYQHYVISYCFKYFTIPSERRIVLAPGGPTGLWSVVRFSQMWNEAVQAQHWLIHVLNCSRIPAWHCTSWSTRWSISTVYWTSLFASTHQHTSWTGNVKTRVPSTEFISRRDSSADSDLRPSPRPWCVDRRGQVWSGEVPCGEQGKGSPVPGKCLVQNLGQCLWRHRQCWFMW